MPQSDHPSNLLREPVTPAALGPSSAMFSRKSDLARQCVARREVRARLRRAAVAAQVRQVEHLDAAELDPQQTRTLEFVQGLVGALARNRGEQADLLLAELDETACMRVEVGVEQARQAARDPCVRPKQAVIFDQPGNAAAAASAAASTSASVPFTCKPTISSVLAGLRFSNVGPSTHSPLM